MGRNKKVRSAYGTPKKGTKRREIVNLLLRKEGVITPELIVKRLIASTRCIAGTINYLENEAGFDIRIIDTVKGYTKPYNVYRIVGRRRWDGTYRSFTSTND